MNGITLKALEGAIIKWDCICQGLWMDKGNRNCPLCKCFCINDVCYGCPVREYTGRGFCKYTPYDIWSKHTHTCRSFGYRTLDELDRCAPGAADPAEKELIFLLRLLPEGHRWREQI